MFISVSSKFCHLDWMALCTSLPNNYTRCRGNPRLGISKRANRYHFRAGLRWRAWAVVTLTWVKACKTLMLFPGTSLPVEIWWRYMASWKMRYISAHEKECSCQLSWCHFGQWCNCGGREKLLPFVYSVSPRMAGLTEWRSCHHWQHGQAFSHCNQTSVLHEE